MNTKNIRAFIGLALLACGSAAYTGCVADRPSRNGVFNENQYIRKAFLMSSPDAKGVQVDNGWMLKATITDVSSPNPLGNLSVFGVFAGAQSSGKIVKFRVTQDKLNLTNEREISSTDSAGRTEEIVNAWPITHVDLKYRINLDGEKTNFYEENQELDWQTRQWVKVNFAKNDLSDIAPFYAGMQDSLAKCAYLSDASATLVPDSMVVDEPNNYMQWSVSITVPLNWSDATCLEAYGALGEQAARIERTNVTFRLMYSMVRAKPVSEITYKSMEIDEHDPIRHKYGPLEQMNVGRDPVTATKTARLLVNRFDPLSKDPVVWYFDPAFPQKYKDFYLGAGGIKEQTNALLAATPGATLRFDFKDAVNGGPDGKTVVFGDVRYNFLRWLSDKDSESGFAGVLQHYADPRTGEVLNANIELSEFEIQETYALRVNAYLASVGANPDFLNGNWPDGPAGCQVGDTMPLIPTVPNPNHDDNLAVAPSVENKNAASPLYGKMQQYLGKPVNVWGSLGPKDFILNHNDDNGDFYRAFYPLVAYNIFADPDVNQFVVREGGTGVYGPSTIWPMLDAQRQFHMLAGTIDRGLEPYTDVEGVEGVKNATAFINNWNDLTTSNGGYQLARNFAPHAATFDEPGAFSFESVIARDARHCIAGTDGTNHWETHDEWVQNLTDTYWRQVAWHEFGHAVGLTHNFMGSIDKNNFPVMTDAKGKTSYGMYSSSVMEYNSNPDRIFAAGGWAPYDVAAISFIYANNGDHSNRVGDTNSKSLYGQASPTAPWNDPNGFQKDAQGNYIKDAAGNPVERPYLYCAEQHLKYTPFCRQGDLGTTPSEIVANDIEMYEWNYNWRNYRSYRKFWNNSAYVDGPSGLILNMRRWLSLWNFDWSESEIADTLRRIGIDDPSTNPSRQDYFAQLTQKFTREASTAGSMIAAFHKAVIQQSAGERPYASIYDKFYGDQQQQGIILDKLLAMQGWVGLWPTTNYDPNQAGGYIASYSSFGERNFETLAEDVAASMVGSQYDAYPYFIPTAVALFAQDTHKNEFTGRQEVREWIGGWTFYRQEDFLNYFKQISVDAGSCTDVATCTYDVRTDPGASVINEVVGPDKIAYIWTYVKDRNIWILARKDRNIATYKILLTYNDDLIRQKDDGTYGAYTFLRPVKYMLDSFHAYN